MSARGLFDQTNLFGIKLDSVNKSLQAVQVSQPPGKVREDSFRSIQVPLCHDRAKHVGARGIEGPTKAMTVFGTPLFPHYTIADTGTAFGGFDFAGVNCPSSCPPPGPWRCLGPGKRP